MSRQGDDIVKTIFGDIIGNPHDHYWYTHHVFYGIVNYLTGPSIAWRNLPDTFEEHKKQVLRFNKQLLCRNI
jgi:hypothetical protein